ncbi:SMI1/KNR4 family protein [Micromonospora halotolerans]|uniref:SMI1/KNR4 family protein n=1 Tax=Micromonospora halotolerans TaxID=709879 RepID=A0ABY9ZXI9_9ACTN|nr:SMI1/KNR4 family protein [Micromonospora halotolerans]WNM39285.1 SMI1/KNR4 family protein [Micromonospora halotolerans]
MQYEDRTLPPALAAAHAEGFSVDHDGHDFEPYDEFMWSVETLEWWQSWTGNPTADIAPFRVFGQDGSGGLAAFWIRVPDAPIETQPIVFLGSEGELSVIARNLGDYLWLLANGVGPLETVDGIHRTTTPVPALTVRTALHRRHAPAHRTGDRRSPSRVLRADNTVRRDRAVAAGRTPFTGSVSRGGGEHMVGRGELPSWLDRR